MELSITGKKWILKTPADGQAFQLARMLGVDEVVASLLYSRGFMPDNPARALQFLSPKLSDMPDPMHLKGMDAAVARLIRAVKSGERIAVFGDYDVDGSCAAALLLRYFRQLGGDPILYIPDRLDEGYGPNVGAMEKLHAQGTQLLITVDCGSLAFEPMAKAAALGMDVIITDHHQTKDEHPHCVALINPNRLDESSDCTMLAGVGVAFYLLMALNRALREDGFFSAAKPEPALRNMLDLVALATVCDMVPLTGVNRILVERGLQVASARHNVGLKALAHAAGSAEALDAYAAGFQLGPRINAGGRISACDLGARLLSVNDPQEAAALALRLDKLNNERKDLERHTLEQAQHYLQKDAIDTTGMALVVAQRGWHPGVVGIVASRLKEQFHRPTFVLAEDENGVLKGSGRSISGVDLGRAVINSSDLLVAGGGHAMAAGITVMKENLTAFTARLNQEIEKQISHNAAEVLTPKLKLDSVISPSAVSNKFMENLKRLAPYGTGNPEPRFAFSNVRVSFAKQVGADRSHLQLGFKSADGASISGIAFRAMESPLGDALLNSKSKPLSVAGVLRQETYMGRTQVKLQVQDLHHHF